MGGFLGGVAVVSLLERPAGAGIDDDVVFIRLNTESFERGGRRRRPVAPAGVRGGARGPAGQRRRWWVKHGRWVCRHGYLDRLQYYQKVGQEKGISTEDCHSFWTAEILSGKRRYRGLGCGDRVLCPICSTYYTDVLASEASSGILAAIEGVQVEWGQEVESFGQKLVLTVPKDTSAWLASEQVSDGQGISKLYQVGRAFVERWWGKGVGGVAGMDFAGESAPTEPHYHLNVYIAPFRREGNGWTSVGKWVAGENLASMRRSWADLLRETFGADAPGLVGLSGAVVHVSYLGRPEQLRHWIRYLYRSPLFDLWKGWQGRRNDGDVDYQYGAKGGGYSARVLGWEGVGDAIGRVAYLPVHWKRIRWWGFLSDGQKGKSMASLGLEGRDLKGDEEGEAERWTPTGESYRLVSVWGDGLVLRNTQTGEIVKVGGELVCWSPKGVGLGRRRRWSRPC